MTASECVMPLFFFFQAEDGIRDLTVTGVQTCALPICCVQPISCGTRRARAVAEAHGAELDGREQLEPRRAADELGEILRMSQVAADRAAKRRQPVVTQRQP